MNTFDRLKELAKKGGYRRCRFFRSGRKNSCGSFKAGFRDKNFGWNIVALVPVVKSNGIKTVIAEEEVVITGFFDENGGTLSGMVQYYDHRQIIHYCPASLVTILKEIEPIWEQRKKSRAPTHRWRLYDTAESRL